MKPIYLASLLCIFTLVQTEAKTFLVKHHIDWVRQIDSLAAGESYEVFNALCLHAQAGDTIAMLAGTRAPIKFEHIKGSTQHPVVVCNAKGNVTITKPVDGFFGMSFSGVKHIKLMGKASRKNDYGICIAHLPKGSAISFGDFSEGIEICGIAIEDIASSGITIKTDPSCYQLEQFKSFHLQGIYIHHNRIARVGNEGIYIGNSFYHEGNGMVLNCPQHGGQITIMPHPITGVNISHNIIDSTGWDGIQVSASQEAEIRFNTLSHCAYARYGGQMSGIFIGEPSKVVVAYNYIYHCYGNAIECFGLSALIEHNLISYPQSLDQTYGIYLNDKVHAHSALPLISYQVRENTIFLGAPRQNSATFGAVHAGHLMYKSGNNIYKNLIVYIPKIGYGSYHYLHGNLRSHFYNNAMYPITKPKQFKRHLKKAERKYYKLLT